MSSRSIWIFSPNERASTLRVVLVVHVEVVEVDVEVGQ